MCGSEWNQAQRLTGTQKTRKESLPTRSSQCLEHDSVFVHRGQDQISGFADLNKNWLLSWQEPLPFQSGKPQ